MTTTMTMTMTTMIMNISLHLKNRIEYKIMYVNEEDAQFF
jgi:hypothetical protein